MALLANSAPVVLAVREALCRATNPRGGSEQTGPAAHHYPGENPQGDHGVRYPLDARSGGIGGFKKSEKPGCQGRQQNRRDAESGDHDAGDMTGAFRWKPFDGCRCRGGITKADPGPGNAAETDGIHQHRCAAQSADDQPQTGEKTAYDDHQPGTEAVLKDTGRNHGNGKYGAHQ